MTIDDTNAVNLWKQLPCMEVKSPYLILLGLYRKANVDFSKSDMFEQYWIHFWQWDWNLRRVIWKSFFSPAIYGNQVAILDL